MERVYMLGATKGMVHVGVLPDLQYLSVSFDNGGSAWHDPARMLKRQNIVNVG